ncbi:TPA: hypothetical protein ACT9IT_001109 [Legionella pneumophila]|nr:hypothetical protein [Legionella pneumophila]
METLFKILFIYILLSCNLFASEAIKVFPQFIGYSFAEYEPYEFVQDEDTCADSAKITINNPIDFHNENEFPIIFNSKLPSLPDCKWDVNYSTATIPDSITSNYDMNKIKRTLIAQASCFSSESGHFNFFNLEAHPVYTCPQNTIFTGAGCITIDKEHCSGDIVARDLDTSIPMIKLQGHVGLVFRFNWNADDTPIDVGDKMPIYTLEVLKNANVINLNTIDSFVNTVPGGYWGEKFGVKSYPYLKNDDLNLIFESLIDLLEKLETGIPISYNFSWHVSNGEITSRFKYIDGQFKQQYFQQPIGFRCDTFIKYLFENGPGIKFDTGLFITPRLLYISLLHLRNGKDIPLSIIPTPYNIPLDIDIENEIKDALINDNVDRLDALTFTYFSDSNITDDTKAKFIFSLASLYFEEEYKSQYLLDLLYELKLFGISSDLVTLYFNTTNNETRAKLYKLIESSILFKTKEETEELSRSDINKIIFINDFLLHQANSVTLQSTVNKKFIVQLKHILSLHNKELNSNKSNKNLWKKLSR